MPGNAVGNGAPDRWTPRSVVYPACSRSPRASPAPARTMTGCDPARGSGCGPFRARASRTPAAGPAPDDGRLVPCEPCLGGAEAGAALLGGLANPEQAVRIPRCLALQTQPCRYTRHWSGRASAVAARARNAWHEARPARWKRQAVRVRSRLSALNLAATAEACPSSPVACFMARCCCRLAGPATGTSVLSLKSLFN